MKLFFGGPSEPQHARALAPETSGEGEERDTVRDLAFVDSVIRVPDWAAWNLTLRKRTPFIGYR